MLMTKTIITYIQTEITAGITIDKNDNLLREGIIDSMGMMKLVRFIEMKFQIQIPFEDMTVENFMSVEKIGDYISRYI